MCSIWNWRHALTDNIQECSGDCFVNGYRSYILVGNGFKHMGRQLDDMQRGLGKVSVAWFQNKSCISHNLSKYVVAMYCEVLKVSIKWKWLPLRETEVWLHKWIHIDFFVYEIAIRNESRCICKKRRKAMRVMMTEIRTNYIWRSMIGEYIFSIRSVYYKI